MKYEITYPPVESYILLYSDSDVLHPAGCVTTDPATGVEVVGPVRVVGALGEIAAERYRRSERQTAHARAVLSRLQYTHENRLTPQ